MERRNLKSNEKSHSMEVSLGGGIFQKISTTAVDQSTRIGSKALSFFIVFVFCIFFLTKNFKSSKNVSFFDFYFFLTCQNFLYAF